MNALEAKIHRMIEAEGPMSVALFMALCLGDTAHGYYRTQEAFGTKGDFITAPDVSQLFGEIIAVYLALCLDQLDAAKPVTLVELGPGRGALMADVLRSLKQLRPAHFIGLDVALVETSPRLRKLQINALASFKTPVFHDSVESLPNDRPLLIIGNEFLDALPMRQFVKTGAHWRERMVTVEGRKLAFTTGASTLALNELPADVGQANDGAIFEIAPTRLAVVEDLAARINQQGGAAVLIDYGHMRSGFGDSLQAMRAHQFAAVLEAPGEVDLTSHVDFEPLEKAARQAGCSTSLISQGKFLLELGLLQRAGALGAGKTVAFQTEIQVAVERLAGPEHMGELFKVLCFGTHLPTPLDNGMHRT